MSETETIASLRPAPAPVGMNQDQQDIWNIYETAKITALKKNLAYGSSVYTQAIVAPDAPIDMAIRVRMSDKINRIKTLIANPAKNMVMDESIQDTFMDLGTYCFLLMIWLNRQKKEQMNMTLTPGMSLLRPPLAPAIVICGHNGCTSTEFKSFGTGFRECTHCNWRSRIEPINADDFKPKGMA